MIHDLIHCGNHHGLIDIDMLSRNFFKIVISRIQIASHRFLRKGMTECGSKKPRPYALLFIQKTTAVIPFYDTTAVSFAPS